MKMHLPFGHKEGESGASLSGEVAKLRSQGKQDREIIVQLKKEGHSFQDIEKAMLQALKTGVNSGAPAAGQQSCPQPGSPMAPRPGSPQVPMQGAGGAQGPPPGAPPAGMPPAGRLPAPNQPQRGMSPQMQGASQSGNLPTRDMLIPSPQIAAPSAGVVPLEAEVGNPTDLIEEVVEGVVEEKFEKADQKFEFLHKQMEKSKEDAEGLKNLMLSSLQKRDKTIETLRQDLEKTKEEFEDLVIKCNALEKAFKQFLPELTEKVRVKNAEKKLGAQVQTVKEEPTEELK